MTNRIISLMLLFCGLTFIETFAHENNFSISVKVTQGIEDAGYLVHIFNNDKTQRKFVDKITVTDKRTSFETHIDEPLVGDLTAIFPDGTVCSACVRFPFVPGEQAQVNSGRDIGGSSPYPSCTLFAPTRVVALVGPASELLSRGIFNIIMNNKWQTNG